ncbi:uncharacterized protein LOC112560114 isoform X3 [Pomacea canaliculata]|nr:uncharacterized protein LOC112560114 isoform X3 [Pomacea canaliculata]
MATEGTKDIMTEARNFTSSLSNVFLLKKRDQQSKHLLEKAKTIIEGLIAENQKISSGSSTPRQARSTGGMGQLWVKLDELKRENDDLKRQRGRSQEDRCSSPKDKGPGDVIISDLQKTKTENEALKAQVAQLQKTVRELQAVNATLQDEYKRAKVALDAAQRSVEKARQDYKKLETSFTSAKTENDSLKQNRMTSSVKPMVRADNRLTENISERCRPTTVALRYNTLESQQWVDAKEAIEEAPGMGLDECKVVGLLCQGLVSAYNAAGQLYNNVELVVAELLKRPTLATAIIENHLVSTAQLPALSDDVTDLVKQKLRQNADGVDTDVLCQMAADCQDPTVRNELQKLSNKAIDEYLNECARVSWQMVVQSPPMRLVADDTKFDDVKHKLWWSCDQSRAQNVDMFVWPVLYDYENGNVLVKGCVYAS